MTFALGGLFASQNDHPAICDIDQLTRRSPSLSCVRTCVLSSDEGKIIHKTLINSGTKAKPPSLSLSTHTLSPSRSELSFPNALVNLSGTANLGPTRSSHFANSSLESPFPSSPPSLHLSHAYTYLLPRNRRRATVGSDLPRIRICIQN